VHLVRHGEVFNPERVLYGRLPGFGLSDRGVQMARAAADDLVQRGRPVARVIASPLQRTQESAEPIATAFDLPIETDDRLIEPANRFEGRRMRGPGGALRDVRSWPVMVNPIQPSWGEPFRSISSRMISAVTDAYRSVDDGDVVLVSHQLPIWMVHRTLARTSLPHDPRKRRCDLSSITTLAWQDDRFVEIGYANPAAALQSGATDVGAV